MIQLSLKQVLKKAILILKIVDYILEQLKNKIKIKYNMLSLEMATGFVSMVTVNGKNLVTVMEIKI